MRTALLSACSLMTSLVALLSACGGSTSQPGSTSGAQTAQDTASGADTGAGSDTTPADVQAGTKDTSTSKPVCNPIANTGCTEAGTHCGYDDTDTIACVPSGTHALGEDCKDGKGCLAGLCVQSQNGQSNCAPFCATDAGCDSQQCNKITDHKYKTCDVATYETCDPIQQDCKKAGQACYDLGSSGFVCVAAGKGEHGDTCSSSSDCIAGYTCAGGSGSLGNGLCRKFCHVTPPTGCDDPTTSCAKISSTIGYCGE